MLYLKNNKIFYKILIESEKKEMLKMNLETSINNLNFIRYMEGKDNENGVLNRNLESEKAKQTEKNIQK